MRDEPRVHSTATHVSVYWNLCTEYSSRSEASVAGKVHGVLDDPLDGRHDLGLE